MISKDDAQDINDPRSANDSSAFVCSPNKNPWHVFAMAFTSIFVGTGCALEANDYIEKRKEAIEMPLIILLDFKVLSVRDIPDQGGSFGVDIR